MGSVLDFRMQAAMLACARTPERQFREIAAEHGVDRETLQERFYEHRFPERCNSTFSPEILRHDAHHHSA